MKLSYEITGSLLSETLRKSLLSFSATQEINLKSSLGIDGQVSTGHAGFRSIGIKPDENTVSK